MGRIEEYREELQRRGNVEGFLLRESRLPGPRANLELAHAYALEGSADQFMKYANLDAITAPQNTKMEFLAFCGILGLGYLLAEGYERFIPVLRERASDSRWRIREAVALGLQRWGKENPEKMLRQVFEWSTGNCFEKRASIAAVCEPEVLRNIDQSTKVFDLLDLNTSYLAGLTTRVEGFLVLRKTLGYCWSVAVSVYPSEGKSRMEKWIKSEDSTIRWIMKQNLRKKRLERMDVDWVLAKRKRLMKKDSSCSISS